jgi:predicted transcriptional regulator of viral defense system
MSIKAFLELFQKHPEMKAFHVNELSLFLNQKKEVLQVELHRMTKKGMVQRLANGYYANPFHPPSLDEVSMILKKPSYISMETALNKYGILPQTVYVYTMITTDHPHTFKALGTIFEYHQVQPKYFFAYQEKIQHTFIADPEKALLDLIYLRHFKKNNHQRQLIYSQLDNMVLDEIRRNKLMQYAKKMGLGTHLEKHFPFLVQAI